MALIFRYTAIAFRNAAIAFRNAAIAFRNAAVAFRNVVIHFRNAAIIFRNAAIVFRDVPIFEAGERVDGMRCGVSFCDGGVATLFAAESEAGDVPEQPHPCSEDGDFALAGRAPGIQLTPDHHDRLLGANLALAQSVLEAARTQRIPRTLIVSSSCVYPDDAPVPTPKLPVCTGEPERINRGYGWAKRHTELLAAHYAETFGMSITIARPFNAFGPRDTYTGPGAHVIPALIDRVLTAENEITVWGSGRQTRSFIHARDVARALALLAARHITPAPVNVGHDSETTIAELVAAIQTVAGTKKPVVFDTTKPEGALRKSADMTKLRRVLGAFEPEVDLLTGLAEMVTAMRR